MRERKSRPKTGQEAYRSVALGRSLLNVFAEAPYIKSLDALARLATQCTIFVSLELRRQRKFSISIICA